MSLDLLPYLDESAFKTLGVDRLGDTLRLKAAIAKLPRSPRGGAGATSSPTSALAKLEGAGEVSNCLTSARFGARICLRPWLGETLRLKAPSPSFCAALGDGRTASPHLRWSAWGM